ncbi:MAG: response regulator, partial [Elainellaceae cyanobacterium]
TTTRHDVDLQGKQVLVVDNDLTTLRLLMLVLSPMGITVIPAQSVSEAMSIIANHPPDLLISDIRMPIQSGHELMKWVRSRPAYQGGNIPAIALSADVTLENIQQSIDVGFQQFLCKPFQFQYLIREVNRLLEQISNRVAVTHNCALKVGSEVC